MLPTASVWLQTTVLVQEHAVDAARHLPPGQSGNAQSSNDAVRFSLMPRLRLSHLVHRGRQVVVQTEPAKSGRQARDCHRRRRRG